VRKIHFIFIVRALSILKRLVQQSFSNKCWHCCGSSLPTFSSWISWRRPITSPEASPFTTAWSRIICTRLVSVQFHCGCPRLVGFRHKASPIENKLVVAYVVSDKFRTLSKLQCTQGFQRTAVRHKNREFITNRFKASQLRYSSTKALDNIHQHYINSGPAKQKCSLIPAGRTDICYHGSLGISTQRILHPGELEFVSFHELINTWPFAWATGKYRHMPELRIFLRKCVNQMMACGWLTAEPAVDTWVLNHGMARDAVSRLQHPQGSWWRVWKDNTQRLCKDIRPESNNLMFRYFCHSTTT
jgi:hypothetical protein